MKTSNQMDDLMDDPDEMRKRLREAKRALACILHNLSYCPWCHLEGEYETKGENNEL